LTGTQLGNPGDVGLHLAAHWDKYKLILK